MTFDIVLKNRQLNHNPPLFNITEKEAIRIYPFDLVMGFIAQTTAGINQDNFRIQDFAAYQRVFTGLENVIARWEGAYKVVSDIPNNKLIKTYQKGVEIIAKTTSASLSTIFQPSSYSSDFLTQTDEQEATFHTLKEFEPSDTYKFFIVPELKMNKFLRVSNIQNFYWNGKFHHSEITLLTMNNTISKSGAAIDQSIQRSGGGEGYAWPLITTNANGDKETILDPDLVVDIPTTHIQIELENLGVFLTLPTAWGRPTITQDIEGVEQLVFNPDIEAPRLLLPYQLDPPKPSPINTRGGNEGNYYLMLNGVPTLWENFADWKKSIQASFDLEQRSQAIGILKTEALEKLKKTNPDGTNPTTPQFLIYDNKWSIELESALTLQSHASEFTNDIPITYAANDNALLLELMNHNFFTTRHLERLPMSASQNITWNLKDIPIVGGFLNRFTLGIPVGWSDARTRIGIDPLIGLIPHTLANYGGILLDQTDQAKDNFIPLETLINDKDASDRANYSGINGMSSVIRCQLTDIFSKVYETTTYFFNTRDLGQKHPILDLNNQEIPSTILIANPKLLWDKSCKAEARRSKGYVIDMVESKIISNSNYRLTFFNFDIETWSGTYLTAGKFSDNIREINNSKKLTNWNTQDGQTIPYPQSLTKPNPPDTTTNQIDLPELEQQANNTFTNPNIDPFVVLSDAPGLDFTKATFTNSTISIFETNYIAPLIPQRVADTNSLTTFYDNFNFIFDYNSVGQSVKITPNSYLSAPVEGATIYEFVYNTNYKINWFVEEQFNPEGSLDNLNLDVISKFRISISPDNGNAKINIKMTQELNFQFPEVEFYSGSSGDFTNIKFKIRSGNINQVANFNIKDAFLSIIKTSPFREIIEKIRNR